jgi:hypothetical protein
VDVETVENHLRVVRERGLVIPKEKLAPFMSQALKKGFDK